VDPRADDPEKEAEGDRREEIALERLDDPGELLGAEDREQRGTGPVDKSKWQGEHERILGRIVAW
jgi:hypothetical protein